MPIFTPYQPIKTKQMAKLKEGTVVTFEYNCKKVKGTIIKEVVNHGWEFYYILKKDGKKVHKRTNAVKKS